MLRYSLRTLLLFVLIAGPLLACGWEYVESVIEERREAARAAAAAAEERQKKLAGKAISLHVRINANRERQILSGDLRPRWPGEAKKSERH